MLFVTINIFKLKLNWSKKSRTFEYEWKYNRVQRIVSVLLN